MEEKKLENLLERLRNAGFVTEEPEVVLYPNKATKPVLEFVKRIDIAHQMAKKSTLQFD